jgi:hypothetical protein
MNKQDYMREIGRFNSVLNALDATHRINGHVYTPAEIKNARQAVKMLAQLVEVGLYEMDENKTLPLNTEKC